MPSVFRGRRGVRLNHDSLNRSETMVPNTCSVERRRHARFSTDMGTRFQLTMAGNHLFYPARIRDICRGGVKLVSDRRLEPGTIVKVMVLRPMRAQVAHCTPQEDGVWALGLSFSQEIDLPELLTLLDRQTNPQWSSATPMVMSVQN
jgi:hypothetical protein